MRPIILLTVLMLLSPALGQDLLLPGKGEAFRVVVFGDFNGPYGSVGYGGDVQRVMRSLPGWQPDLVLLTGDLVAGQDSRLPDGRFAEMWQAFDTQVAQPLRLAEIPYAAALGNHDASSLRHDGGYSYARERSAAQEYWLGNRSSGLVPASLDGYPFNWSFGIGDLFVIVWDASSSQISQEQLSWLLQQLASPEAARASRRWLVGHLPLFGISEGRATAGEVLGGGAELALQLAGAGLDTYVSGHQGAWYPGSHAGLELLMSGGIGGRRLIAGQAPVRSTVTVADLLPDGVSYLTVDVQTGELVDPQELPDHLDAYGGRISRSGRAAAESPGGR